MFYLGKRQGEDETKQENCFIVEKPIKNVFKMAFSLYVGVCTSMCIYMWTLEISTGK